MSRKDIPLLHEKAGEGSLNAGFIPWYDAGCAEFWAEANGCLSLFRSRGEVVCGFARGIFWDGIADAVSGACVMVYSWAWKYFLLASILDVKPKAMLFVVYKIPGYKTVMLWEFFLRILPRAIFPMHGICLVQFVSWPEQRLYLQLAKYLCWVVQRDCVKAGSSCKMSSVTQESCKISRFGWHVLQPKSSKPGKILNSDCLGYFQCELFWTSSKCPLQVRFLKESGKSGWPWCCFEKTLEYSKAQKQWCGRLAISATPSTGGLEVL